MDTIYNGYKITFAGEQFPTYRSNWDAANSVAGMYFLTTGKEAKIYGFIGESIHLIRTWRKPSRT